MAKTKKAVSPVVATVLLIAIVVIIALLIFIWASNFFSESGKKMGKSAEQACSEVNIEAVLDENILSVINNGNIPVYSLNIEKTAEGSVEVEKLDQINLIQGSAITQDIGTGYSKIELVPIILVQVKNTQETYLCENNKVNVEI